MAETAISFNVFYMYAYVSVSYDDCFVKIWATCENFLGNGSPPPPAKNCPYAYASTE